MSSSCDDEVDKREMLPGLVCDKIVGYMNRVKEVDGDLFSGRIVSEEFIIEWHYDKEELCCEDFGVMTTFGHDLKDLIGKSLSNEIELDDFAGDEGGECTLKLGKDLSIDFYNWHNGYYTHNLDILVMDKYGMIIHDWNVPI